MLGTWSASLSTRVVTHLMKRGILLCSLHVSVSIPRSQSRIYGALIVWKKRKEKKNCVVYWVATGREVLPRLTKVKSHMSSSCSLARFLFCSAIGAVKR